jgi:hypothetical protein
MAGAEFAGKRVENRVNLGSIAIVAQRPGTGPGPIVVDDPLQ